MDEDVIKPDFDQEEEDVIKPDFADDVIKPDFESANPAASAEASTPKSPAPTSVSPALAPEPEAPPALTWESGDGGEPTLPVGEKNQWGGNLRTEGRKPLIRRNAKGKVSGYSTTTSMGVTLPDGRIAVVPTVIDGVELSTEDAAKHYADTGEYWGMADNEDGAKKIARAVHDEHQKAYQEGWNEYIQSHWDDMGDEIRRDPGVRGERARRRRDARIAKEMEAWGRDAEAIKGYRERTKTTQVAPELFLTGDLLEDADGNAIKPGDAIAVYHKEGDGPFTGEAGQAARLMEFTGVSDDGKPVFKETEGVSSEGAMVAGKLHVRDEDFDRMMGKGEGKVERSPFEQVRLGALAETGDRYRYTDDALGTAKAVYDRLAPYAGRMAPNEQRERTRHLSNIYEGKLDGYEGKTEAEKYRDAARKAGLEPWNPLESLHPDENDAEFMGRIQHDAGEELRLDAIAKLDAGGKLSATEQSVLDKIVKGGVESGGWMLEFALPGGAIFKGAKALNWGVKAVRAATMLGSAVPVVATEAMSRYQENITPEYGFDDNGEFKMVAAPDDEDEAAYKAIGGAIFDTAVEVGLEAATMGLLRLAGKATGWLLGKATPGAVREFGVKRFNKFMASETGQALRSINRAYQDFTLKTGINNPGWEWGEENVQAFEKFLNLDGKTSEHKGFAQEWQDFKDNQFNWQTQWDIFYGLIAQLAIGSAKSAEQGVAQHISSTDARRDIRMALKRSGISDEAISTLTPEQQKTLDHMWRHYSSNPDELKAKVKNLGISMRLAADELLSRESSKMAAELKRSGIEPEKFVIQTGEDGKPAFQQMMRFDSDGSKVSMNAMTDVAHGVTIVDQGNGTFHVMNDWRGLDAIPAYSFEEAQKKADEEVLRNQRKEADNKIAAQRLMELTDPENGPYRGRKVVSIPSEAALRWQVAQAVHDGGDIYGITRADQLFKADGSLKQPGAGGFHTPDGHIVVILDNVPSPAEMERVLAHEATGHEGVESATGRGAKTVEFIQNAQAEGFSKFVLAEQQRAIQKFVAAGMDEATARMQVAAAMSTDEYAREAMARYAQGRLHQPTWYEKRKHELNQRRRKAGEDVPIDQSDLEVMLAEAEKQGAKGANKLDTLPGDSGVRYEEGATDEARNGADEAQPQQADENAGRDGQQPAPQTAEGSVEGAPPRAEAPDAGVVGPSKSDNGGQNMNTAPKGRSAPADTIGGKSEPKPKGKRGDNLRGRSYEDYAASPDDGGTADEMGAALLRFVRDNGGLLKMPPKGVADPMADWINAFLDGGGRKKNRGEFIALFGMKPKTGANDAITESMPTGLKDYVEKMIERDGPGAVADWFLETRRKYREWVQGRRDAAREERQAVKDRAEEAEVLESFDFDELAAARDAMDEEFANALGVVEGADEADYAALTPASLQIAKSGDTIRFDHDRKSFVFGSFDAGSGVLVVYDEDVAGMEGGKFRRAYRVTENSIEEIDDGQGNEVRADADRAGDEKGPAGGGGEAQGGGFRLESVTAEQITADERKSREKAEIKKRQEAPLKGSGQIHVQPEMDLGQTGQQDLFSPIAGKPQATQKPDISAFVKAQREAEADDEFEGDRGLADLVESLPPEKAQKLVSLWNESNRLDDEADKLIDEHSRLSRTNQTKFDSAENERKHSDLRARARDLSNEAYNMLLREAEANGWEQGEDAETGGVRWVKKPTQKPTKTAPASAPRAEGRTTPPKSADAPQDGKSTENATQRKYAELLSRLDEATKRLDAAVEAEKKSGGAIADQIASREAIIDQYRAELAVRRFEREHKNERLGQNWSDVKDRPYTSLTDNGIRERIANATTSIAQLKEELPKDAPKSSASTTPSATPSAKPAFKRGDRVFLKGAKDGQRVTFLKANADGTADVQVRTPGANRYAPEKVETRTVPMGDVSSTGMKDTLTGEERNAYRRGVAEQTREVMRNDPALRRIDAAYRAAKTDAERAEFKAQFAERVRALQGGVLQFDTPELSVDYSSVPERLDHSLWWITTHDEQMRNDIAALRKTAERNIKAGADDTPSESEARDLKRRINEDNANAREYKRLAEEDPLNVDYYKKRETYYREDAKELRDQLKELKRNGIGEDREEIDWYTNGDLLEILDSIESGEASTSMHFDPYAIGRGESGPFAEALKNLAESGNFKGKGLERLNRVAQKINDAYKRIEADIEDPRGPFGESLVSFDTPELSPVTPAEDAAYMDAVRRGDMETAERMVREAAEHAGYRRVGFHGTSYKHGKFTKFNKGSHVGSEVYQALNRIGVETDGPMEKEQIDLVVDNLRKSSKDVLSLIVKLDNPLRISDFGEDWSGKDFVRRLHNEHPELFTNAEWTEMVKDPSRAHAMIEDKGYDGLVYDNGSEGILDYSGDTPGRYGTDGTYIPNDAYIPFHPSQIKSADPVTYDDAGNVIPLSQRFNQQNEDIRFDTPELTPADGRKGISAEGGYNPRSNVPNVRGGWTEQKILRYLKANPSLHGVRTAARLISEFDTVDELKDHMFYHGTRNYVDKMQPSMTQSERWAQEHGGGGYGQRYWGISVSKSKKVASNFGNPSPGVSIYPVVLAKGAKVIDRPDLTDAADVEDHIVELWNDGVDAVRLGDWKSDHSEQELLVLNPRAICNIGTADSYRYFRLGSEENPLDIKDDAHIARMLEAAREYADYSPVKRFGKPTPPSMFVDGSVGELKPKEVRDAERALYEKELAAWRDSEQGHAAEDYEWNARDVIRFDTTELTPADAEYVASGDKTPTEKVMREVYGMTNDEIATALRASGMEPPAHVKKSDETKWQQAEVILSNPTYMAKLSRAAAKFPRPLRDFEIDALNVLFRERQNAVNAAQGEVDDWKQTLDSIADGEVGAAEKKEDARKNLAAARSGLARAKALMLETGKAKIGGASEQGRGLRANRGSLYQDDLTYAGITGEIAQIVGGADRITPEMDAQIRDLAKLFEDLDAAGRRLATERAKPIVEKIIAQTKNGLKVRKATERRFGDEAKRVARNYENALIQIEVGAVETGGTLIGMTDKMHDGWRKWLNALGEFHCFENPNITEEEVVNAILEDISPFVDGVDADQVRDVISNLGHNYKMSRYDSQRLMNSLRNISRYKRQIDWMDETNTMPPATGPIRDEPTQDEREWAKRVRDRKAEVPDAGRDERRLKSTLDTIKRNLENRIADLKRAIETGERIPAPKRKVVDDIRVRELRAEKDEWQKRYDELFGTTREMTDAQRIALTEKLLAKELEHAMEDFARAQSGDFSKRPQRPGVTSATIEAQRDRIRQVRESIRELKKAKYEFGMTPEETEALNARKMASREKALARLAERIATGDIRPQKKPQPPMTKDQQKRYDELGEQMRNGQRKLRQLREDARRAADPEWKKAVADYFKFFNGQFTAHMASFDRSAVMRQALRLTAAHPLYAAKAMAIAEKTAWSRRAFDEVNGDILADPVIQDALKYGLKIRSSDVANVHDVEMFSLLDMPPPKMIRRLNDTLDKIPLLGRLYSIGRKLDRAILENSERHYVTYINLMVAQTYRTVLNAIPGATEWQKREIAQIVNMLSGAGAMSEQTRAGINKLNDKIGHLIWSPNLWASQIQQFFYADVLHPMFANREGGKDGNYRTKAELAQVLKEAGKLRLRSELAILALGAMLAMFWSDDDWWEEYKQAWKDGRWWKALNMTKHPVLGKTHIDLEMGQRTVARFVSQFVTGEYETSSGRMVKSGDFGGKDLYDMLGRIIGGKLSPVFGTAFEIANRKSFTGEPLDWPMFVSGMLPLTPVDVVQSAKEDKWSNLQAPVAIVLTILGAGGNVYDEKYYERAVNRFLEAKKEYDAIQSDDSVSGDERNRRLSDIREGNPLMRNDVRGKISAHVKRLKGWESKAKKAKKAGKSSAEIDANIEKEKENILKMIREARK